MQKISDEIKTQLTDTLPLPFLNILCNDNLCSSITIYGSYDIKESWVNGIFENSKYFILNISSMNRYYSPDDEKIVIQLFSSASSLPKFRKYTGPVDKVISKLITWIKGNL